VQALLKFEAQRLAVPIECAAESEHEPSTTCVVVRLPHADAPTQIASITASDGRFWTYCLAHMPTGTPLCVDTETGPMAIASVDESLVRLAFDPNTLARENDRGLLSHLWDQAVVPALEQAARHVREMADTAQVEAFARLEERWHRETIGRLPGAIENNEYSLTRLESQMRDLVQKTDDLRRQERALHLVGNSSLRDDAKQQWSAIRRLVPEVYRSVELQGSTLLARTYEITIEHDEMSVDVGEFEISIDVVGGSLSITNRTNPVGGVHHPHVRSPTEPCWGNIHASVTRLAAEREWAGLLAVIKRFLEAYNDRDSYVRLDAWDPTHHDSDDDDYDDDDSEDETVECTLCLEQTASDEITHVGPTADAVCLGCFERDTFVCGGCTGRFTSRNQARESLRCTGCATPPVTPAPQEVAS
jgi:hypothetical protein